MDNSIHLSHKEHPLILPEVLKDDDDGTKEIICYGCKQHISSHPYYGCSKCQVFLHKDCAESPTEIRHLKYHKNPLKLFLKPPYDSGFCECSVCGKQWDGFTYHCSACLFNVEILCAQPKLKKFDFITNSSHGHPLIPSQVGNDKNKEVMCNGCGEYISTGLAYGCNPCQVYLHKSCAESPDEIKYYHLHEHTLQLNLRQPYRTLTCPCDVCGKEWSFSIYCCKLCNFNVDFLCAKLDGEKIEKIRYSTHPHPLHLTQESGREVVALDHFSHDEHPLILKHVEEYEKNDEEIWCYGCNAPIWSGLAYGCTICKFENFLHKVCAELPTKISYLAHPDHPLRLFKKPQYTDDHFRKFKCNECGGTSCDGFCYRCLTCDFDVHFSCAHSDILKRSDASRLLDTDSSWKIHPAHPHHRLQLVPRPASFKCDACRTKDKEYESYRCHQCDFWLHKTCASYPTTFEGFKHHEHPLSLAYSAPEECRKFKFYCVICGNLIHLMHWVYYCAGCRYFFHLKCFRRKIQEEDQLEAVNYKSNLKLLDDAKFDENLIQLPVSNISVDLIHRFLLPKKRFPEMKQEMKRLFHKQHPLILFTEQITSKDLEDEDILCDGCTKPITAPYYGCVDCNYYLHQACQHLPSELQHPRHPHLLGLVTNTRPYQPIKCSICRSMTNGFFYKCDPCKYQIDLKCAAAFPSEFKHKAHSHPLESSYAMFDESCKACMRTSGRKGFACKDCHFFVENQCVMLPATVRHRSDKRHPLVLRFPPHFDHPDDFICDLCEDDIHPNEWIYLCLECDLSFHPRCIPGHDSESNLKFGQRLRISSHPHPFKCLSNATMKEHCDECHGALGQNPVFECETCYLCLCPPCVEKES